MEMCRDVTQIQCSINIVCYFCIRPYSCIPEVSCPRLRQPARKTKACSNLFYFRQNRSGYEFSLPTNWYLGSVTMLSQHALDGRQADDAFGQVACALIRILTLFVLFWWSNVKVDVTWQQWISYSIVRWEQQMATWIFNGMISILLLIKA